MKKHTPLGISQLANTSKNAHPTLVAQLEELWQESAKLIETKIKSKVYTLTKDEKARIQTYLDSQNKLRQLGEVNGVNFAHAQLDSIIARTKAGQELEIEAFKTGGVFVITHMVESEGYFAGVGTHFPAVKLSLEKIKKFYTELLGEDNFVISEATDEKEKARTGYHGMAIIVGKIPPQKHIATFDHMAKWAMSLQTQKIQ